ncbi:hypothetical protein [Endothiovibrio diazotrophicus]
MNLTLNLIDRIKLPVVWDEDSGAGFTAHFRTPSTAERDTFVAYADRIGAQLIELSELYQQVVAGTGDKEAAATLTQRTQALGVVNQVVEHDRRKWVAERMPSMLIGAEGLVDEKGGELAWSDELGAQLLANGDIRDLLVNALYGHFMGRKQAALGNSASSAAAGAKPAAKPAAKSKGATS